MSKLYDTIAKAISDSYPQFVESRRRSDELAQRMRDAGIPVPPLMCPFGDCAICEKAWNAYTEELSK